MNYYTITTDAGDQALAAAWQAGTRVLFQKIAVGDANGAHYEPTKCQTSLKREVWRGDATVSLHPDFPKRIVVTTVIPSSVGGFSIREAGILDSSGKLLVVAKMPLSDKVAPESGASNDLVVRLYVEVSDAEAVTITMDQSAVLATMADVAIVSAAAAAHSADLDIHVRPEDKERWDGKADVSDLPQKLPNPHPIDFAGAVSGRYDGTAATTITIPTVPTALKNPQALTITGAASATYDGSTARTVNIPTTAQDTGSIAGALTVSTAAPGSTLGAGKLWGRY